jgi:hypothetical protein
MRVVVILVALTIAFGVGAYQLRGRMRDVSQVLLGFSILFALMLLAAFFNLL